MNDYRWEQLTVGLKHEFEVTLTAEMMRAFEAISGDNNPLHVDVELAKQAGYAAPVVFGLLTSAFYSQLVGVHLPGRHALLHGLDLHFVTPAFVGDRLKVTGEITYLTDAVRQIELRGRITNQLGKTISKAKIRVGLHVR